MLLLAFLVWLFFTTRSVVRLRGWLARVRSLSPGRLAWDVGSHFLTAGLLLGLMYVFVPMLIGRGYDLSYVGRYFLPDITLLVIGAVLGDLGQGTLKLVTALVFRVFVRERSVGP